MNPLEGLSVAPLSTASPPAWLTPWLRADFSYALVQPILDVTAAGHSASDEVDALVALAAALAGLGSPGGPGSWHVVPAAASGAGSWDDAGVAATSPAAAPSVVAATRRGRGPVAFTVGSAPDAAPVSVAGLLHTADVVVLVLDAWSAVVGAPNIVAAAGRLGAHVQPEAVDPPATIGRAQPTRPSRSARTRLTATMVATAAVLVAAVIVIAHRGPDRATGSAASAPSTPSDRSRSARAGGLLLPSASRFPGGRNGASTAFDPLTGSVTLFGGGRLGGTSPDDLFPRDTWSWDVNGWRRISTTDAPPAASDAAFAYDEATGSALLFGGIGGDGSTWRWNGLAWSRLHPVHHPAANVFASAVFDPRRQAVLLATLCCQTSPAGRGATVETWEWRGNDWVPLRGRGAPVLSRAPLITYDIVADELLLFTQGSTPASDDTDRITTTSALWSFDGSVWHQERTPVSPPYDPIRDRFGYDPAGRRAVLFQGGDQSTWVWSGSTWREFAGGGPPYSGALSADATVGRMVLFGGQVPSDDLSDVWTLERQRWRKLSGH